MSFWETDEEWIKVGEVKFSEYICTLDELGQIQQKIPQAIKAITRSNSHYEKFVKRKTISLIWCGNKLETNCHESTQNYTSDEVNVLYGHGIPSDIFAASTVDYLKCLSTWDAEGGNTPLEWKCMGEQSARAYFVLKVSADRNMPLTIELMKLVHHILMSGAMENNGQFRTHGVSADGYEFVDHSDIDARMRRLVVSFEDKLLRPNEGYGISIATQLLLDFVTIHPFSNGNGRMCRFLFSYALQRMNFPFPVALDSGHTKTYKHYVSALKKAQTRNKIGPLLLLAAVSIYATLTEYATFSEDKNMCELLEVPTTV